MAADEEPTVDMGFATMDVSIVMTHTVVTLPDGTMLGSVTEVPIPGGDQPTYVVVTHDWYCDFVSELTNPKEKYQPIVIGTYDDLEEGRRAVIQRAADAAELERKATA